VTANEILENAEKDVQEGVVRNIDLLGVQKSIDSLEKVFFANGIRSEVISPTQLVGPILDAYLVSFNNAFV